MISIDSARCTSCGFCIDECPNYVLAWRPAADGGRSRADGGREVQVRYPEQCCRCDHCVAICPETALADDELPAEEFAPLPPVQVPPEQLRNLLLSRRSIRAFQDKPVPKELVEQLIEAGVHAGTASNGQTEGFLILQDRKTLADLERLVVEVLWKAGLKYLGNRLGRRLVQMKLGGEMVRQITPYHHIIQNRRKDRRLAGMVFRNAPLVIVGHGLRTNYDADANCTIATRNMEIMAAAMGLGTCWVGFLRSAAHHSRRIGGYLAVAEDRNIYSAIMVGYPKHAYTKAIPRKHREVRWI